MAVRQEFEQEFYPGRKFNHATDIYDILSSRAVEGITVTFNFGQERQTLGITDADMTAAEAEVRAFLALRIANRAAFADFAAADTAELGKLATQVNLGKS